MALQNLSIQFDSQPPVYFPGKPVSGKIEFAITEPLPFDHVRVQLHGSIGVKRTKTTQSVNGFAKSLIYSAWEICCDQEKTLLEGNTISTKRHSMYDDQEEKSVIIARKTSTLKPASVSVLKPGPYSFAFTFFLPLKLASSFEGSYGQIRYFCKTLITCNGAVRFIRKEPFTLIGWADLNYSPTSGSYFQTEANSAVDEKGGKILARLHLRQQGYAPGELMQARMELVNNGVKSINTIYAQFVQRVNYTAKRQQSDDWSKWEERRVLQQATRKEKVAPKKNALLKWDIFTIPACCPTMLIDANIIRVQYELQLHLQFDSSGVPGLILVAPIIIGTIPLKSSFDELRGLHTRQADSNSYLPFMERYPDMLRKNHANQVQAWENAHVLLCHAFRRQFLALPTFIAQSPDSVDIRDPSDLVFMPDPISYVPLSVMYEKSTGDHDEKRGRKQGKDEKSAPRSRSTLSRFSFRSASVDNLATTTQTTPTQTTPPKEVKEEKKPKSPRKWGKKKDTSTEIIAKEAAKSEKVKKGKSDKPSKMQDKSTQEPPPVENGRISDAEISCGDEEFF